MKIDKRERTDRDIKYRFEEHCHMLKALLDRGLEELQFVQSDKPVLLFRMG